MVTAQVELGRHVADGQCCKSPFGPEPELPDRMFFEAVLYCGPHRHPLTGTPSDFADCSAVYNLLRRRIASRRPKKLFEAVVAQPACDGTWRMMIDSTIVGTHQHAARPAEKWKRGVLSVKIVAVVTDEDGVVAPKLSEAKTAAGGRKTLDDGGAANSRRGSPRLP